jgi:hypothetical protein
MKRILSIVFALTFASALLAGCDRPAGDAASGGTSPGQSAGSGASGSAGDPADRTQQPKRTPSGPAGSGGTKY